jgi:hypothetical protein
MKKRIVSVLMAVALFSAGCSSTPSDVPINGSSQSSDSESSEQSQNVDAVKNDSQAVTLVQTGNIFKQEEQIFYDKDLVPSIAPYSVKEDFSNVVYDKSFEYTFDPQYESEYNPVKELRAALIKNNFAVETAYYDEFFDVYESNRYQLFPSFITTDSIMHTYHIYFAHLLEKTEKDYLSADLSTLSKNMMDNTLAQYKSLKGTEWEEAALRNLEFFGVANLLQENSIDAASISAAYKDVVNSEYEKVMNCSTMDECAISKLPEDYTQYKPRGYYVGDAELEKYFRTMMWYGRIPFALDDDECIKSAILMSFAIAQSPEEWNRIYSVTSFFAGASDDPGYNELAGLIIGAYGSSIEATSLPGNSKGFDNIKKALSSLKMPEINSIPVMDGDDPVIPSFRFMGQRFTVDAAIMQKLIYSAVKENSEGDKRMLPDTLDVPAALGSGTAASILKEKGAFDYQNYTENMSAASDHFNNASSEVWDASLYSSWLNTLRPLLEEKPEGYPSFMLSEEWNKKSLETFAGSFAELKHDTILYSKAAMAEMGGGDIDPVDDRGYVSPEPVVYSRLVSLSNKTRDGLLSLNMLSDDQKENLDRLSEICMTLLTISEKELKNEELSSADYDFIREYGGYIEHFWFEANKEKVEDIYQSEQAPCPVIADIATDPNGEVLEVGSGYAHFMYVVFPVGGELHVGRGAVYSFYQFNQPMSDRLTDPDFKKMISEGYLDDNWNYVENEDILQQPEWTQSYRIK